MPASALSLSQSPFLLHLPKNADATASKWRSIDSDSSLWQPISISEHTNVSGGLVFDLDAESGVELALQFTQSPGEHTVQLPQPGHYVIQLDDSSKLQAQPVLRQPLLLVSDLDDTMILWRENDKAEEFRDFWKASRAVVNCRLVYNTGRTLPLYEEAFTKKGHQMALPDVLVCGVGTRIYYAADTGWVEDEAWTAKMDEGWNYEHVREVLDQVIATLGTDKIHYRDEVELHKHKQTVLVRRESLVEAASQMQGLLSWKAVQAVLIQGGIETDWKFIDVVPLAAGKGSAMKYLRDQLGFGETNTVAAGDSSNDRLMLEASKLSIVVGNCTVLLRGWAKSHERFCQVVYADKDDAAAGEGELPGGLVDPEKVIVVANEKAASGVMQGLRLLHFW